MSADLRIAYQQMRRIAAAHGDRDAERAAANELLVRVLREMALRHEDTANLLNGIADAYEGLGRWYE